MTAHEQAGLTLGEWLALPVGVRIRLAASLYLGWRYPPRRTDRVSLAFDGPGLPKLTGTRYVNCSPFTASILCAVYPDRVDAAAYGDLVVFADRLPTRPDSPILAVERMGVGTRTASLSGWSLCQGWRSLGTEPNAVTDIIQPPSGHAFLVSPAGLKLESTNADGYVGPRWSPVTLDALRKTYPAALYLARLAGT